MTSPATPPAAAQDAPGLELRLVSQPMTVAPNGDLVVVLAVDGQLPADAEVVVTTYQMTPTRESVRAAIEQNGGIANDLLRYPVATLPRDDDGNIILRIGTETDPGDANRIRLSNPGLYPVSIDIRIGDGPPAAALVTFVERTGDDVISETIGTAAVLTFDAAPSLQATGLLQIPPEVRARLDSLIALLEQSPVRAVDLGSPGGPRFVVAERRSGRHRTPRPARRRHRRPPRAPGGAVHLDEPGHLGGGRAPGDVHRAAPSR